MCESDLGCVVDAGKHGFAIKGATQGYAIKTASEFAVNPGFDAMGMPQPVQFAVGGNHVFGDPGAGIVAARHRASPHHFLKNAVNANLEITAAQAFGQ